MKNVLSIFQFHFDQFDQVLFRARKAYEDYVKGGEKYAHLDSKDMDKVGKAWIQMSRFT